MKQQVHTLVVNGKTYSVMLDLDLVIKAASRASICKGKRAKHGAVIVEEIETAERADAK